MSSNKRNPRLRYFARINAAGQIVPGSTIARYRMPRNEGNFVDLSQTAGLCCTGELSYALFRVTSTAGEISSISYPGYEWTGTLGSGDYLVIPLPYDFGGTLTVTTNTNSGMIITTETVQGTGEVSPSSEDVSAGGEFQFTADALPASQYLFTLLDD